MFAAVTRCYNSVFRRGHVDPRDMQRSAAVQLSETEAYVTTDITLVRQMAELKMLGDRWRKMAAERQIKLNDGTPDNLLRRLERVEDTIDHTRVEWSLAVRTPADHSAALWLDVDTLLDNESALMMHLEQLQIRGKDVQVAVSVCDLHILSAIGERCWQLAAVMLTGAVLRETAPNMPYYTEAAPLASSLRVLSIPGVESRVRALTVKGIRTRVFHRGRGEFAFVFSRKTPRGPLRRNEARPGTQKQLGAVRDGADEAGEAEEDHTGGVAAEVEAVMRHIVRDLSTALRHDLPLELLLPQNLRAVEPLAGAMSDWVSGVDLRRGALHDALDKLEEKRALARAAPVERSVAQGEGARAVSSFEPSASGTDKADLLRDETWLRQLGLRQVVPRMGGVLPPKYVRVKLRVTTGEGLMIQRLPGLNPTRRPLRKRYPASRLLSAHLLSDPPDEDEGADRAALGAGVGPRRVSNDSAKSYGVGLFVPSVDGDPVGPVLAAETRADRTVVVKFKPPHDMAAGGSGAATAAAPKQRTEKPKPDMIFVCEFGSAAKAWVVAINEAIAVGDIGSGGDTYAESDTGMYANHERRTMNTRLIRL